MKPLSSSFIWIGVLLLLLVVIPIMCAGCAHKYVGPITGKTYTTYAVVNLYGAGPDYNREVRLAEYLKSHPDTKPDLKQTMLEGKVQIGMTQEQVLASWDKPSSINQSISGFGTSEQWVYGDPLHGANYLYFQNGKLTSIQTSR